MVSHHQDIGHVPDLRAIRGLLPGPRQVDGRPRAAEAVAHKGHVLRRIQTETFHPHIIIKLIVQKRKRRHRPVGRRPGNRAIHMHVARPRHLRDVRHDAILHDRGVGIPVVLVIFHYLAHVVEKAMIDPLPVIHVVRRRVAILKNTIIPRRQAIGRARGPADANLPAPVGKDAVGKFLVLVHLQIARRVVRAGIVRKGMVRRVPPHPVGLKEFPVVVRLRTLLDPPSIVRFSNTSGSWLFCTGPWKIIKVSRIGT